MKQLLDRPELYHAYQVAGGFFGARIKAFRDYVDFSAVRRVFDIGCGPGHIVNELPAHVEYVGFDTDTRYVEYANRAFGQRGRFVAQHFDTSAAEHFGQPDVVLMNGVLHHMDDEVAALTLRAAASILPETGRLFALDGCYEPRQHPMSRYLIENDRGEYVREAEGYRALVASAFPQAHVYVRNDLSWVPYTFAITLGINAPPPRAG